jgi:AcrR family transcriptional regulator
VPRTKNLNVRTALIERAAALLADHEPVTLRGLAASVGTSTMAVYTNFGGMPGLWSAVRQEGFLRLAQRLEGLENTADPVADLTVVGSAYVDNALANGSLYLHMFDNRHGFDEPASAATSFGLLITHVARAQTAKRFTAISSPESGATQMWAMTHGMVMLTLTGALTHAHLLDQLPELWKTAYVGFGDTRNQAAHSVKSAWKPEQVTSLTGRSTPTSFSPPSG